MHCPKCLKRMESVTYGTITIERCRGCQGLWFDALKHEKLLKIQGAETVDVGDSRIGQRHNRVAKTTCPRCKGSLMVEMVALEQPHIWYEKCSVCGGVYFDAGEFRDLKEKTLLDMFRRMFTRGRR